jgi:hypothetical protein
MLRLSGGIAAFLFGLLLGLGPWDDASGQPIDCGATTTVKCLAGGVFSLAKTLPDDNFFRQHVEFAEQELAPGDIKTAIEYVEWDNPDPSPWEDIDWIAKAGRFDRAIEVAKQRTSPVQRVGALLAVASYLLDKNDTVRAGKIVTEVERELASVKTGGDDNDDYVDLVRHDAGVVLARIGQIERSAGLIGGAGIDSVDTFLMIAAKYPVASSLREKAWSEAERIHEPYAWQLVIEDAITRNDLADTSRAGQQAVAGLAGVEDADHALLLIGLARVLLTARLPELSAKLIKPWRQWIDGKDAVQQRNVLDPLIPVLAGLAQDQEVEAATHTASGFLERSQYLSKAAEEYFRIGRSDVGGKFDTEALRVAVASPVGKPELQQQRDAALANVASSRADHGDIQGALDVVAKLGDAAGARGTITEIVRRAIEDGYGPVVGPVIEVLQQQARVVQDAGSMLQAANFWYEAGNEERARQSLDEAMRVVGEHQTSLGPDNIALAAELMWRIQGKGEAKAMLPIVDKLGVNDPSAIDHLVEIMKPVSPSVAVQLAGRQTEVDRRIDELAGIGIAIAEGAK